MGPIRRWQELFFHNSFMRHLSVLMAGTAVSNLLIICTTPILTRLYTPEEFGSLSIFLSILYTLTIMVSLRYESAIPLPKKEEEAYHLLVLSMILTFLMSIITFLTIFVLQVNGVLNIPGIGGNAWLIAISLLGIGLFQALNCWSIRTEEFDTISKAKVMMNSGQVGSQMLLGFLYPSVIGLLIGEVIGRFSGAFTYLKKMDWSRFRSYGFSFVQIKMVSKRYKSFPLLSSWSALLNNFGTQLPVFFLVAVFDTKTAGFFFLAQKILTVPEGLLGFSASQVYMSQAANQARQSYEEFRLFYWGIVKKMIFLGGVAIGAITLIAPPLIQVIFGDEWIETGSFLQALALMYVMRIIVHPLVANFYVFEAFKTQIVAELVRFILILISILLSLQLYASPVISILWISIGSSLGYAVIGYFSWYTMKLNYMGTKGMRDV